MVVDHHAAEVPLNLVSASLHNPHVVEVGNSLL